MTSQERIHEIILRVYDAAADESLWPDTLQSIASEVDALGCIFFEWEHSALGRSLKAPLASSYYDHDAIRTYVKYNFEAEAQDQDIFEARSLAQDRIDLIEDDVLAPSQEALKKRPNVQTLLKVGILHRAACLLNKDNTAVSRFSIQLARDRGRLLTDQRVFMGAILPHVAKAMELGRPAKQLSAQYSSLLAAMDRLSIGICLVDAMGRVVQTNEEFERQRDIYREYSVSKTGELKLYPAANQKRFAALLDHAFNHGQFGARPRKEAIATDGNGHLCIEVTPLTRSEEMGSQVFGGYILYSTDTARPFSCNTRPLQTAYELTDTEALLAGLLGEGLTNALIADRRGRSVATVNAQVKSILAKTGCTTRTQLVRLMMTFGTDYIA